MSNILFYYNTNLCQVPVFLVVPCFGYQGTVISIKSVLQTLYTSNLLPISYSFVPYFCIGIYAKFANAFAKAVQTLQVGNGLLEGTVQVLNFFFFLG